MEVCMQKKIRLYYNSVERDMSVFLKYFFEMVGIYVHEELTDIDHQHLLDQLNTICKKRFPNNTFHDVQSNIEYDANIFYVTSEDGLKNISDSEKNIVIANRNLSNDTIVYSENNLEFLMLILDCFLKKNIITKDEYNQLTMCAQIYYSNKYWELILRGNLFFRVPSAYEDTLKLYQKLFDNLCNCLKTNGVWFTDSNLEYVQYAALRVTCDMGQYQHKYRKPVSQRIDDTVFQLLQENSHFDCLRDSIDLLIADYYRLAGELINYALDYYRNVACVAYNQNGCFRLGRLYDSIGSAGLQSIDRHQYYLEATRNFAMSIERQCTDFRSWSWLGSCLSQMGDVQGAYNAYGITTNILHNRFYNHVISPLETDYLFRAYNYRAFVINKFFNRYSEAIKENYCAIDTYWTTETSSFYHLLGDEQDIYRNIVRSNLNLDKIYYEISKLKEKINQKNMKYQSN